MTSSVLLSSFTPSNMAPEVLEAIFVKRDPLAERIVESVAAAVIEGDVEHHLAVGPRGMGKTHLLTIIVNRLRAQGLGDALAIAWLREEEWGVTNVGELYEQMLLKLADDPTADVSLRNAARAASDDLLSVDPDVLADAAESSLTELLAHRRLVVVIENLDEVFASIGEEDQHQLRAYLQTHQNIVLLASSPSLSPSIATRDGLFWGFFAIHHLDELTVDEARDLLLRIAELRDDEEGRGLRGYLTTPEATNRLQVVARIAGGHPRLWVLMSECITTERLDEIVSLLHALLDDLTPYYQSQMASLTGQQRKVVTVLARTDGALIVKDIATRARLAHNAAAKHIGDLVKLGYVRPAALPGGVEIADKRSKAYELREPLLKHCLELKESRGEPLRLIVEFLRAWFAPNRLRELADQERGTAATYLLAAIAESDQPTVGMEELEQGRFADAAALARSALQTNPEDHRAWGVLAVASLNSDAPKEALAAFEVLVRRTARDDSMPFRIGRAAALLHLDRAREAMDALRSETSLPVTGLIVLGQSQLATEDAPGALRTFDQILAEDETDEAALNGRRDALIALGRFQDAVEVDVVLAEMATDPLQGARSAVIAGVAHGAVPDRSELSAAIGEAAVPEPIDHRFIALLLHAACRQVDGGFAVVLDRVLESCPAGWRQVVIGSAFAAGFIDLDDRNNAKSRAAWQRAVIGWADPEQRSVIEPWIDSIEGFLTTRDGGRLLELPEPLRPLFSPTALSDASSSPDGLADTGH